MSRLDVYLCNNGFAKSRERAKSLIKSGRVTVNEKVCTKPAYEVGQTDKIYTEPDELMYVGRGGLKLEKALDDFCISVKDKICADIGASTGGFTQCLLEHGAKTVYAIDVGHGQLDSSLVNDSRVINCEGVNARHLRSEMFSEKLEFISVDVSFISLELLIYPLCDLLDEKSEMVTLIKPQFEAGKKALNKKGIVKDPMDHIKVLEKMICVFNDAGLTVKGLINSGITGGDGNIEYLAYLCKDTQIRQKDFDLNELIKNTFSLFR